MGVASSGESAADRRGDDDVPLFAMLSQVLVAFTIEFDCEYQRRMRDEGQPGFVSFAGWRNVLRYVGTEGASVRSLTGMVPMRAGDLRFTLGGLERWGFVAIKPPAGRGKAEAFRAGFGSSRGFSLDWTVEPTPRTKLALGVWPDVLCEVDSRWRDRFGPAAVDRLRGALARLVEQLDPCPPEGLADRAARPWATGSLLAPDDDWAAAARPDDEPHALPVLVARALWSFAVMFDREAPVPLGVAANLMRVLGPDPLPVSELAERTGIYAIGPSPLLLRSRMVEQVARTDGGRGGALRLSPVGVSVKETCSELIDGTERRWVERYGRTVISDIAVALTAIRDHPHFGEGMQPPPNVPRSGTYTPGFDVGPPGVMRKRARAMADQTRAFTTDPRRSLPHYPVWDGNAGFGP